MEANRPQNGSEGKSDSRAKIPEFDADFGPDHPSNQAAARAQGLHFERGCYRDDEGCMIRDKFGQPF